LVFDVVRQPVVHGGKKHGPRVRHGRSLGEHTRHLLDMLRRGSPPDGPVEIELDATELRVRDHGLGIDPEDLPHVFERFYRAPEARARPGAGLGLALVHKIAEAQGWDVE
jgi:two-component system sensor histidine kinase MprB